jgi:tRNA threonylcarbamoyladenosine biosynthesis protein TsaB
MTVLAIDTALGACSAAVGDEDGVRAARFAQTAAGQTELLIPMIRAVLDEAGLAPGALTRIAVTIGPGSFAGTRIGLAAARAMARVHGIPVLGLTSLEALAGGAELEGPRIVAFDARKGQLYLQAFAGDLAPLSEPVAASLLEAEAALGGVPAGAVLLGSGAAALGAQWGMEGAVRPPLWPNAADFLMLAARHPATRGPFPRPLYLRAPGAVPYQPTARP